MTSIEKTISTICIILITCIIIVTCAYEIYDIKQASLRKKELDKKRSDCLQQEHEINESILKKLQSNELNVVGFDENENRLFGKTKTKRIAKKKK